MNKKERAEAVRTILSHHFPNPAIPLQHRDPYTLLIAVMLSAQCTDARVNQITPQLFQHASSAASMKKLTPEQIAHIIRPCGLAGQKSKAIWQTSVLLDELYDGAVPADLSSLEALPGVGHKTASVVLTQAFGIAAFPVDTHIHRCACRWGLSDGKSVQKTESDLKRLYPPASWHKLHLQIIYFARKFCPARGHDATQCPICSRL